MKSRTLPKILLALFASIFLFLTVFFSLPSKAYAYSTVPAGNNVIPTGDNAIANIFDETQGKFLEKNLNALAKLVKDEEGNSIYGDITEMITAAEGGKTLTSSAFGESVVYFGKNVVNKEELAWIPAYISKDNDGNAILTLWLAYTDLANSTGKQQEIYCFNEQWNNNANTNPSSNNYSTSKIRSVALNNGGKYYTGYGNTSNAVSLTSHDWTATKDKTNKFEMYTTGALKDYIVAPSQVGWQNTADFLKNDPSWSGNQNGNYTATAWLNDKLWLPSIYEIYDGSTPKSNKVATSFSNNGGLWGTSATKLSNTTSFWLRSGNPTRYNFSYFLDNGGSFHHVNVADAYGVRPALHLNLTKLSQNMIPDHKHVWESANEDGWVVTTPATCDNDGVKTRVCTAEDCDLKDKTETQAISKLGHSWATEFTIDTPATCTTAGSKSKHCTREGCDGKSEVTTIPTIDHTPEAIAGKPPTCTETGLTDGSKCSVCGTVLTAQETIAAKGHAPEEIPRVEPTCEGTGLTAGEKCNECGTILTAQTVIPANGHDWGEWSQTKAPTEEAEGEEERECGVCHKKETQSIAQLEHTHKYASEWTSDETNHWHASTCGHNVKKDEATHDWGDGVVTKAATCSAEGLRTYTCSVCQKTRTEAIAKIAHTEEIDEAIAATCTTAGKTEGKHCSVCEEVLVAQQDVPVLGHDYKAAEGGKAPTCTEDGYGKLICSRCGDEKNGEVIPATGHKHEVIAGKAATCTESGLTDGDKCPTCGTILTAQEEIKALGHDFGDWVETLAPTFTADGEKRRDCSRCDEFETDVIPKKEKVAITVTINPASSEVGDELEALTATVTTGTLIDPADVPYTLSTDADKDVMGTYTITGTCTDTERYSITFIDGVYIVSKKADDPNGGGEIDLPVDVELKFSVSQSETKNEYPTEDNYIKRGYWAQLWEQTADGDREFTGKLIGDDGLEKSCILTLTVPNEIISAIRNGGQIDLDKLAANLGVSYVSGYAIQDGVKVPSELTEVDNFKLIKSGEKYSVKFTYDGEFGAEIVFSALNAEEVSEPEEPAAGIPWWVWLIVGLAGAALVGVVVVIIVVAKKKSAASVVVGGAAYDDAELKAKLSEQDKKLDEIKEIVDGGFNDIVDDE